MSNSSASATMALAIRETAGNHGDIVAVRTADDSVSFTWSQLLGEIDLLAGGLVGLGVGRPDTVALLMGNRPEFHIADMAVVTAGGTPFSVYQTYTADQIKYLLEDAAPKVAIVSSEYLDVMLEAQAGTSLETIITVDGETDPARPILKAWAEVRDSNPSFDAQAAAEAVDEGDVLTLIYTSGTTGPPKGVELTHGNLLPVTRAVADLVHLQPGDRLISWLPAAHIAERDAHHYIPIVYGASITCCPDPRQIIQFLPQVRPNWFFAVPRIWEKLKAGLEAMLEAQPSEQSAPLKQALKDATEAIQIGQRGETVPAQLAAKVSEADETYFKGLRTMLGLDDVRTVGVGAAPTPPEVIEFFHAIGIELAELWGMSETCGYGTLNPAGAVRIGTVGPPSPGAEIQIADDGEVLIRGACVMKGYRNNPKATAETIDSDGWLHTGDIGILDEAGYLKIVDRKKEIIINAAGKNMSPANIEATVKTSSPLIGQACVIGDARPYNTALIVLDVDMAPAWAAQHGIAVVDLAALSVDPQIRTELEAAIDRANQKMARVEQIKRFVILPTDWEPGGDELTPTMKLKRKPIAAKYSDEIEELYA
ncbi:MAG: long-chain fatty acid--CoA ligase [Solirubrobacterales bacterium]|nr:long-chain fatty acid--CoA ligase [Solirubrobacterales bacterium]